MYNVIIADDEKNIREGISELINWNEIGCYVCAAVRNGEQVLDYIENGETKIDLVITDIKMPIMDGMELAGVLHEKYPNIRTIILTAYSDFTYAQQAIRHQVAEFVIKNDFFRELPRAVKHVVNQWEQERGVRQKDIISMTECGVCRVCACEIKMQDLHSAETGRKNLKDLAANIFQKMSPEVIEDDSDLLFIVIDCTNQENSDIWFRKKLEKLVALAATFQNMKVRIGVSGQVKNSECMTLGKKQAIRSLSGIYTDKNPVYIRECCPERAVWEDEGDIDGYMRNLYVVLRNGSPEEIEKMEEEFRDFQKKESRPLEQCRSDTHAVISYLFRKIRRSDIEEKMPEPESVLAMVYSGRSKAALLDVLYDTCSAVSSVFSDRGKGLNRLVEKTDRIIERSYQEKLRLNDISKELFVNSSYLSRIYKKQTGYTVTEAVNRYRIKMAKEILETGQYKVYEVARMVGIEDPAYFTHVFLKYEGINPSDYSGRNECDPKR